MKITKIRVKGQKPETNDLNLIVSQLSHKLAKVGFITEVEIVNSTCIKVGQRMRSFSLDLTKHDRNLQVNPHLNPKLTNLPTWDQRVQFNNILNEVLNKLKVSANVKSGPYTIRQGTEAMTESYWHDQKPDWVRNNDAKGFYIESIDEKSYLEERRQRRLIEARTKRELNKQREEKTPHLLIVGE